MLRKKGVVEKFVEFFGPGLSSLSLADRAMIANMSPENGATITFFPVDQTTLEYLRLTGRSEELIELVEAYCKAQHLFRTDETPDPDYTDVLELDLGTVEPSLAGPKRPQDRVPLSEVQENFEQALILPKAERGFAIAHEELGRTAHGEDGRPGRKDRPRRGGDRRDHLLHQHLQPFGDDRRRSAGQESGRKGPARSSRMSKPAWRPARAWSPITWKRPTCSSRWPSWVLTWSVTAAPPASATPARCPSRWSRRSTKATWWRRRCFPATATLKAGSAPIPWPTTWPRRRWWWPMPWPARSTSIWIDEPLGTGKDGQPVYLRDIWPTSREIQETILTSVTPEMFKSNYAHVFDGNETWNEIPSEGQHALPWERRFDLYPGAALLHRHDAIPHASKIEIRSARVLAVLGDSITTDHISPAGSIPVKSPAGQYLIEHGVNVGDFNSYGSRRGNDRVMTRGTFANIRLKNLLVPGVEGGFTVHLPDGEQMTHLRRRDEIQRRGRSAGHPGRERIRHRLQPRLGGQRARCCWA